MRWSWWALASSGAVCAIAFSCSRQSACGRERVRSPVIPVRDGHGPIPSPTVSVDPRARAPPGGERDGGAATIEIVPLGAVEHREKFGHVQPVHLADDTTGAVDQPGKVAKVEQGTPDASRVQKLRAGGEQAMQAVAAHQRAVREENRRHGRAGLRRTAPGQPGGQEVSTAWRIAFRKSGSGTAPSNCMRSLITTFGTPITR